MTSEEIVAHRLTITAAGGNLANDLTKIVCDNSLYFFNEVGKNELIWNDVKEQLIIKSVIKDNKFGKDMHLPDTWTIHLVSYSQIQQLVFRVNKAVRLAIA